MISDNRPNPDGRKPVGVRGLKLAFSRASGDIKISELLPMYLVLRAREGDQLARDLLEMAGTRVHDIEGNLIWPVEDPT
jgi:hypothetical protein